MCPVCKRELAPTLSICFTCGAMVHDTVREELQTKIGRISGPLQNKPVRVPAQEAMRSEPVSIPEKTPINVEVKEKSEPPARPARMETSEFGNKKTSPTLVGFQAKNSTVPDWRLQLQNSVRQRKTEAPAASGASAPVLQKNRATNGANALKAQYVENVETANHENPRVAKALKRIEDSRRRFSPGDQAPAMQAKPAPTRNYPFNVVSPSGDIVPKQTTAQATVNTQPKPRLVSSMRIEKKKYDTNKLPPMPAAIPVIDTPIPAPSESISISLKVPAVEIATVTEHKEIELPIIQEPDFDDEEVDDLAGLSSRFIAGLFDVIIGGFATAIALSPLLLSGRQWLSIPGVLAIVAAFGVVMFIYLTLSIGLRGRTLGMRLFSLEMVDAEENEYPTLHQAAVNSAVFLLALPLLGIGFLSVFFNEERRAAHDLVSGTILVKEI